ncbi:gas vesicle protein GvpN [Halobacillus sp. BBL2006]|uniref:gas vesicle protein GvpN n=1 Tax=Halobacillus sp. BBL2006 TaxID=1543706 RepID=UPI000543C161|nr:gas vesicle protein GvpN [Halobacillus sp. BBL2006]KHE72826.1 gas vesicle protein GvpN [Halobacillus sp. BBL2006]
MTRLTKTKSVPEGKEGVYDHPFFRSLIRRSLRYLSSGYPVHYTGPSGVGKTTLALHVAKKRNRPVLMISGNEDLSNEDLIGAYKGYSRKKSDDNFIRTVRKIEEEVTESWVEGRLYEAVKNGYTVVYDEFTRSRPDTNNLFLSVIEEKLLPLYGAKRKESHIKVHPDFSIIFTSNPTEYVGIFETQDALLDRMITIPFHMMDKEAQVAVVRERTSMEESKAEKIVDLTEKVNGLCEEAHDGLSLRASIMIADILEKYDIPVDGKNEDFQNLVLDITYFTLNLCNEDTEDLQNKILDVCRNV